MTNTNKYSNFKEETVCFASKFKLATVSEDQKTKDIQEAFASLKNLKLSFFQGDPEKSPDLLYVMANLLVPGTVNKNDDAISAASGIKILSGFRQKFCDLEHKRDTVVGVIVDSIATSFDSDLKKLYNDDLYAGKYEAFNISTTTALWRAVKPALCDYIDKTTQDNAECPLSLSMEVRYLGYDILMFKPEAAFYINDAVACISPDHPDFEEMNKALRINKGSGMYKGFKVARLLMNVLPLGEGIVIDPAGAVSGLVSVNSYEEIDNLAKEYYKQKAEEQKQANPDIASSTPATSSASVEGEAVADDKEKTNEAPSTSESEKTVVTPDLPEELKQAATEDLSSIKPLLDDLINKLSSLKT